MSRGSKSHAIGTKAAPATVGFFKRRTRLAVTQDAVIKRCFPALVGAMIAAAAYFQASGMSSLMAEAWMIQHPAAPPPAPLLWAKPPQRSTSAAPILARNPFDSITGALDTPAIQIGAAPHLDLTGALDPYADPPCDTGRVVLIVEAADPDWSFAAIAAPGSRSQLRRRGDEIAGRTVHAIARDRVWLVGTGARCQLQLGIKDPSSKLKPAAAPAKPAPKGSSSARVPPEIASRIQKVSEREFNIDRSAIDLILEKQAELMRSTRVFPIKEAGKVTGFRLQRVTEDSLLGTIGLKNGDQVRSINGFELTDPQRALEAYSRLRTTDHLTVALQREGKDMTVDLHIR